MSDEWASEYMTMIEDCEKRSGKLSEWELGFIDSLSKQIGKGRIPSRKQIECLDKIWERIT